MGATQYGLQSPPRFPAVAVALGGFDGLHVGHMALFRVLSEAARSRALPALAYTFSEPPRASLESGLKRLTADEERRELFSGLPLAGVYYEPFTPRFAAMDPEGFVKSVLADRLRARLVVVGFNYRFGRGGAADAKDLARLCMRHGAETLIVPPFSVEGRVASSSLARALLAEGDVAAAGRLLGRLYAMRGEVQEGRRLGRRLGFPTANLMPDAGLVAPAPGVYVTSARFGGRELPAVTSIGTNPTAGELPRAITESNILGFSGDIYGEPLAVRFHARLRGIVRFPGLDALKAQIARDSQEALGYFAAPTTTTTKSDAALG